jgi:signal transduction histidine kinase
MNEPQTVRWPWAVWACMLCLVAAALTLSLANDTFDTFVAIAVPMMIGYGTIGAFVASRVPGNSLGWLMLTVGLSFGVVAVSSEYLVWAVRNDAPLQDLSAWLSNWVYVLTFLPLPTILLLFPTGRVLSPRWRIVLYVIAGSAAALAVAAWIRPGDVGAEVPFANPTGVQALEPLSTVLSTLGLLGILVSALASVLALVVRYRRSADIERSQIRALAYVAGVALALLVPAFITEGSPVLNDVFFYAFFICIGVAFPTAIGWAILRYRLYDIDLVVKKTVTFSLVAIALTGLYLALIAVATLGNISRLLFGIVVVVLTFRPVLGAARSIADRVVYGRRATPYEVMSEFSERMSETYSTDDVLPLMVQVLQGATGAERADVWLRIGGQLRASASSSSDADTRQVVEARDDTLPSLPGSFAADVRHHGELLGALAVTMPPNDPLDPSRRRLVHDLAAQAGPVLRNVRLIEELRASRQRLVAAQDGERRKLERNIHDGAQQQLVALGVQLRLADTMVDRDPAKARELLTRLQGDTQTAINDLRDLARGIYPPLLADQGLGAALEAQARKSAVPVDVAVDGVGRLSQDVEAAVYFSCLEALQNVAKYAKASRATISLATRGGSLVFTVADDGRGFDPTFAERGSGLQGMTDRIEAIGGTLEIDSTPGRGTTVSGRVPATPREGR